MKKEIKIIIGLWVLGILLAYLTRVGYLALYSNPAAQGPTSITQTQTYWINQPASSVADVVRHEFAWTIMVICPFLYGPILTLIYIITRFRKDRQPIANKPKENLKLEVAWTIIPAFALIAMGIPAYDALRYMEIKPTRSDQVVNITGAQFFWQYEFPRYGVTTTDNGTITLKDKTDKAVEEDSWLHLPVDKTILLNGQSFQVNHAWWVPAFGLKFDVIPGHVTTNWFKTTKQGYFKGQCAELCGTLHSYMLIHVKVEGEKEFYEWILRKGGTIPAEEEEKVVSLLGSDYRERFTPKESAAPAFPTAPAVPVDAPAPAAGAIPPSPANAVNANSGTNTVLPAAMPPADGSKSQTPK